jgi:hypothetical protein
VQYVQPKQPQYEMSRAVVFEYTGTTRDLRRRFAPNARQWQIIIFRFWISLISLVLENLEFLLAYVERTGTH